MTDDAIDLGGGLSLVIVPADARDAVRKIVQERDALRAEVAEMEAEVHGHIKMWGDALRRAERAEAERDRLRGALEPLRRIADAFDANELDDEARKFWGQHSVNTTPHEDIELYQGRGGKQLLTLADCMFARAALTTKGEADERA
jgi:hypothetical protein